MAKKYSAKDKREFRESMQAKALELRKYCHRKDCRHPHDCPRLCIYCVGRKKFNLSTAIAWNAATSIAAIELPGYTKIAELKKLKVKLGTYYGILYMHYKSHLRIIYIIHSAYSEVDRAIENWR